MSQLGKTVASIVLGMSLASAAWAHDTWLLATRLAVPAGAEIVLDLTSGMEFPVLDHAIEADRVGRAVCRLAGRSVNIADRKKGSGSLRFRTPAAHPGVASLAVTLEPKAIELKPDQVSEYLDEIGAPDAVLRAWNETKEPKRWREVYSKHAKTFVRVGEPGADRSWAEPLGLGLEIVPERDPTALHAGEGLPVRLLKKGTPLPAFSLGIAREGEAKGSLLKTDADGRAVLRFATPGRWLLRATDLRRSAREKVDWESEFTTLTLEVK